MTIDWESVFASWAQPPGKTEQERCENAEQSIRKAIMSFDKLKYRNIKVFAQGSYRNRVNVKKDSDVDIGILCYDTFFPTYPEGITAKSFGHTDATYQYSTFKNDVGEALVNYFGSSVVERGNKTYNVHENTYHVEADVTPFFEHRRYTSQANYYSGVRLHTDSGEIITNWPEQHYENGISKNTATGRGFKALVRTIKSLRNTMDSAGMDAAKPIQGFDIECLLWNAPNWCFSHDTWDKDVQSTLAYLWANTKTDQLCSDWGEVSELKYLFRGSPSSKREQAFKFINKSWEVIGVRP